MSTAFEKSPVVSDLSNISRGDIVVKAGVFYRVASLSKSGVAELDFESGGFAMYSHVEFLRRVSPNARLTKDVVEAWDKAGRPIDFFERPAGKLFSQYESYCIARAVSRGGWDVAAESEARSDSTAATRSAPDGNHGGYLVGGQTK